jgi:Rieske 2Fe-2S family protein
MDRPDRLTLEDIEPALPARLYLDADHYDRELRSIWYDSWVHLCRSEELARPGEFRVFELGSQSILVIRGSDGELRAFHNTCRHRGSALCIEEAGRLRGSSIVCPYHQWTYSLEGRLRGTPYRLESPGFRYDDYPLYRVALEERAGFVFVHLGADPPPLLEALEPGSEPLANWHLEDLRVGHRTRTLVECNWKIFWENFHECLHCPSTHPELVKIVPTYGKGLLSEHELTEGGALDSADALQEPALAEGAVTWTLDGQSRIPTLPGLSEEEKQRGQTYWTLEPSFFVVAHRDYARRARILPRGVERTEIQMEWLFPPSLLERDDFDLEHATALGQRVVEQDARACELNQRGLRALPHERGVLVKQEYWVARFQKWVLERLDDAS